MSVGGETLSGNRAKKKQKERKSFLSDFLMAWTLFLLTSFFIVVEQIPSLCLEDFVLFPCHMIRFLCLMI